MYLAGVMLSCLLVAVQAVVWRRGHMRMSLVVAVQMPWDIARCMLTVVHHNAGICMSGVVSHLCIGYNTGCTAGDFGIHHTHTRQYRTCTYTITMGAGSNHGVYCNTMVYGYRGILQVSPMVKVDMVGRIMYVTLYIKV